jgi:hypothetical protein
MSTVRHALFAFAALATTALTVGCSSSADADDVPEEQDLVPESAKTLYDQVGVCDAAYKRHAAIKVGDLHDGLLRWACGDVPGVTGKDLGQEYCEYKAVQDGKIVRRASDLAEGKKLTCVFTSVYSDVKGSPAEIEAHGKKLAAALKGEENLGVFTDAQVTVMKGEFNSRGAATALIRDCAKNAKGAPPDEARQVACWLATTDRETTFENKKKLRGLCRGKDLGDAARWAKVEKLGAKVVTDEKDKDFERHRDLAACIRTRAAGGVDWRNSDPLICARVTRAVAECKTFFNAVPDEVEGFTFTGWINRALPPGCRRAKVDGKEHGQLVLCDASAAESEDIPTNPEWSSDLRSFCRERFGNDLVMQAPLRALQKSEPKTETKFCSLYAGKSEK